MINNRYRITSVDMFGFNGRDYHPSLNDVGLEVMALSMTTQFFDAEGNFVNYPSLSDYYAVFNGQDNESAVVSIFHCVTSDGRFLDMIDFELSGI